MTRLLLYAQDPYTRSIYRNALEILKVDCDAISSFSEMFQELPLNEYSGLLVDVVSSIRASVSEKAIIHDLLDIYPSLRLKYDGSAGGIMTLAYGKGGPSRTSLEDFIALRCRPFEARPLRCQHRAASHCHVLLSHREDFSLKQTQKTVTLNLAEGGCFLFSADRWEQGQAVWLKILGMEDNTPIRAEIRWRREWGEGTSIPGIGVKFLRLRTGQSQELAALLK